MPATISQQILGSYKKLTMPATISQQMLGPYKNLIMPATMFQHILGPCPLTVASSKTAKTGVPKGSVPKIELLLEHCS